MPLFEITSTGASQALASLDLMAAHAESLHDRLEKASDYIYDETRHRFDTEGEGEWEPLSEATVAKKESQGFGDPARILYAEGNLYESATSPNGPYSVRVFTDEPGHQSVTMVVDWESDGGGWQLASVLAEGNDRLPARPIWPPVEQVVDKVSRIIMAGI